LLTASTASTKHLAKDVAKSIAAHIEVEVAAARTATKTTHGANATHFVVFSTLRCIAHYVIRSRDVFELLFSRSVPRIRIRVVLPSKTTICLRDVFIGCLF
jgi:hypothetical protein